MSFYHCNVISVRRRQIWKRRLDVDKFNPKRDIFWVLVESTVVIFCDSDPLFFWWTLSKSFCLSQTNFRQKRLRWSLIRQRLRLKLSVALKLMIAMFTNLIWKRMGLILIDSFRYKLHNVFLLFVLSSDDVLKTMIFYLLQWQSFILRYFFIHNSMIVQLFLGKFYPIDL